MRVLIPSPLHSYTHNQPEVEAQGQTVAEVLADLDARFPGFRFRMIDEQGRIRPHVKVFVDGVQTFSLAEPVRPNDDVQIVAALSGG